MNVSIVPELYMGIPNPESELIEGVPWGRCDQLFTPAYWKVQYRLHEDHFYKNSYRSGNNLIHEICACILGGFGIKAELAMAAFRKLLSNNLLEPRTEYNAILSSLNEPLVVSGVSIKYRFPVQKSKYLFQLLQRSDLSEIPTHNDLELRSWLLTIKGIGMKTASWITRNWLCSVNVAILDIHIYRAGLIAGIFDPDRSISKNYLDLEKKYLEFCSALDVNAANLDALIWSQLKMINRIAINILK